MPAKLRDAEGQVVEDLSALFVRVPPALHEELRRLSDRSGAPLAELVRTAVARYIEETTGGETAA